MSDPALARLRQLAAHRAALIGQRTALVQQLEWLTEPDLVAAMQDLLARLDGMIAAAERATRQALASQAVLQHKAAPMTSVPGVGPVLVTTLLARLPELGQLAAKPIAALAGLAPYDHQVGAAALDVARLAALAALPVVRGDAGEGRDRLGREGAELGQAGEQGRGQHRPDPGHLGQEPGPGTPRGVALHGRAHGTLDRGDRRLEVPQERALRCTSSGSSAIRAAA